MIRRIVFFLGLCLALFFAYRRYDAASADAFLTKVKNFSFSNTDTYTTTISDSSGSGHIVLSGDVSGTAGKLLQDMFAIVVDQNLAIGISPTVQTGESVIGSVDLELSGSANTTGIQGVVLSGVTGSVVIKTGTIDTISAVSVINNQKKKPSTALPVPPSQLSEEDKRQAEEFSQMFSN